MSAAPPTIAGAVAGQSVSAPSYTTPFAGVTITDTNSGTPTDSVTLTISGDSGATLTGTGLSGSNPYTLASDTPANITTKLRALHYRSTRRRGQLERSQSQSASSAGTTASNSTTTVQVMAYVAETPLAAPVGTWTPVSGAASYKGVNIAGAEQSYPSGRSVQLHLSRATRVRLFRAQRLRHHPNAHRDPTVLTQAMACWTRPIEPTRCRHTHTCRCAGQHLHAQAHARHGVRKGYAGHH